MAPGLCLSSWSWGEAFPRVLMGTGMGKTTGLSHSPYPVVPELGWDWPWEQHPGIGQGGKHCAGSPMPTLSWRCPGPAEEQSCILEPSQQ